MTRKIIRVMARTSDEARTIARNKHPSWVVKEVLMDKTKRLPYNVLLHKRKRKKK